MSLTTHQTLLKLQKYLKMEVKAIEIEINENENIYLYPLLDDHKSHSPIISHFKRSAIMPDV